MDCEKCGTKLNSKNEVCSCSVQESAENPSVKTDLQEFLEVKEHIAASTKLTLLGIAAVGLSLVFVPALVVAALIIVFTLGIGSIFSLLLLIATGISDVGATVCAVASLIRIQKLPETSADRFDFSIQAKFRKAKKDLRLARRLSMLSLIIVAARIILTVLIFAAAFAVFITAVVLFIIGGIQLIADFPYLYDQLSSFFGLLV